MRLFESDNCKQFINGEFFRQIICRDKDGIRNEGITPFFKDYKLGGVTFLEMFANDFEGIGTFEPYFVFEIDGVDYLIVYDLHVEGVNGSAYALINMKTDERLLTKLLPQGSMKHSDSRAHFRDMKKEADVANAGHKSTKELVKVKQNEKKELSVWEKLKQYFSK